MAERPHVDVNLLVYNSAATVGAAIESVLAQSWPALSLTVIDDGSDDGTTDVLAGYATRDRRIRLTRNRHNGGAIANFQRAFWFGDADFVLPKSGDDLIAPDFIAQTMAVLLAYPNCAMCHAGGLLFTGEADVLGLYPPEHRLNAVAQDPIARSRQVMTHYTSSPSFWGIYRRAAVDRLGRIRHRAGWDHALLAELALYGEIRHVPEPLYWRREGGKPILHLARVATERGSRGLAVDDSMTEPHWRVPLISTAFAHLETFAAARVDEAQRAALMRMAPEIFRARWMAPMRREAAALRAALPTLYNEANCQAAWRASWMRRGLDDLLHAVEMILPEEHFSQNLPVRVA